MVDVSYKKKTTELIKKAKEKGKLKTYDKFCKTKIGKKCRLSEEETLYYTSKDEANNK